MKLTLDKIADSEAALAKLAKLPMSGLLSYKVSRLMKSVLPLAQSFHEARDKLLREVGEPAPGQPGSVKITNVERWNAEMKALVAEEVEIEPPISINAAEFSGVQVEPSVFFVLDWAIKAPE